MGESFKNQLSVICKYNFEEYNYFNQIYIKSRIVKSVIITTGIFFLVMFYLWYSLGRTYSVVGIFKIMIPIYTLLLLLRIVFRNGLTSVRRKLDFDRKKLGDIEHHFTFNEDGTLVRLGNINTLYSWENFYKALESNKSFFLYITKQRVLILPKRVFQEGEMAIFKSLVLSNMDTQNIRFKN